jgi:hypothetical protein
MPFTVIAIIAAYNEADIIGQVVSDLIAQGVDAYVIDHGSTDGTVAALQPYLGRGLRAIEPFPRDDNRFAWERLLQRKEVLARELAADWFVHHDADEFRESPWRELSLRDAIQRVDTLGYNAVDFALFNFQATHDGFRAGDDVRAAFPFYDRHQAWDRVQIRCWKKTESAIDLASSGGHEVRFDGRAVFPIRFVLRHYPIRGQAHGERKVFEERRFIDAERDRGWHVQYDGLQSGQTLLKTSDGLTAWDPDGARFELVRRHRDVERLEDDLAGTRCDLTLTRETLALTRDMLARAEAEREHAREYAGRLAQEMRVLHASKSWRWTGPLRALARWIAR